ncbi:sensor histidine kinase [Thiohalocapsa sp. ML1]|uniref:sensor histidine kinase n=1 Tax=Thiohalocapsa sp. ML1 TaxID=1431688 RepID=UPI0009E9075E|nr:HAMP domain-containing sensor histidine kinase [Thiohalocapsa sp. ML1]
MNRNSLRARLAVAALLSITLALLVAAASLVILFERHVERRIGSELTSRLNQLAAAVHIAPDDGAVSVEQPPQDPRFGTPLGGLYWQVDDSEAGSAGVGLLRSRSLWDTTLALPQDALAAGEVHTHRLPGPGGQALLVRERSIRLGGAPSADASGAARTLRLAVAEDRAELVRARNAFAADMLPYLGVIALVLGLATWAQIRAGLAPLEALRKGVYAVRAGTAERLPEHYPDEVQPLVAEVNALLAAREASIVQARSWTADLAHGLKTPLSALAADADRLRQQGNPALANDLEQLALHMRRRVDRELIRARMRSGSHARPARADVSEALNRVLGTLKRTPDGARLAWRVAGPNVGAVALPAEDLLELLGNLLENAAKWARRQVDVQVAATAAGGGDEIRVAIADDGPGIAPDQLHRLGQRGLRLDEQKAGSGLGLAIARDIVAAYGGEIDFGHAEIGGLAVRVCLPAAPEPTAEGGGRSLRERAELPRSALRPLR